VDAATAEQVGRRKAKAPIILLVNAKQAYANNVVFYRGNDSVWLADFVPSAYLERCGIRRRKQEPK
jgi:putative RNA 2'-phosphotransferase